MLERPGKGAISRRPLHFFWIADSSGSMAGEKINTLNQAIRNAIPEMQKVAGENPYAELLVRAIEFDEGARWHVSQPTPVESFRWDDLKATGQTMMGKALSMVAAELKTERLGERGFPPVLVLITDGQPTDDFRKGLKEVMDTPWGRRAARLAISIGRDADVEVLREFIGNPEIPVLEASSPERLRDFIRFVSTAAVSAVAAPPSQVTGDKSPMAAAAATVTLAAPADASSDVW